MPLLVGLAGCAGAVLPPGPPPPVPAPGEVVATLFLIGDAGAPKPDDPVLRALGRAVGDAGPDALTVFLGDNVYPRGIPEAGAPERAEAERRLLVQVAAVREAGGRAVFIPGNHDWAKHGPTGWDAVRRQADLIAREGGGRVRLVPEGGCPGPAAVDVGDRLRVLALDTHWWLHGGPRPEHPDSECPADDEGEVTALVRTMLLGDTSRTVVVVGHHPFASGGEHGGNFLWTDHLFPLRAVKRWLWIPLPVIGSLYPLSRQWGISNQDMPGPVNRRMRDSLNAAFTARPPLLYVSGHEHNLQLHVGSSARWIAVSGTGYYGHVSPSFRKSSTVFAVSRSGFLRLDLTRTGSARLGAIAVESDGSAREVFAQWLE